jgi:chromosome segregation ATPase
MAKNNGQAPELEELHNRLEWLDEERRKANKRLAELEKRAKSQERELESRDKKINELEEQLSNVSSQVSRLPQLDTQLAQFKDELVGLLDQYDERRVRSEEEMERLRRVEHESNAREIAKIRKELPAIDRLQNEMELRQAEESRLANKFGVLQNRISAMENQIENWPSEHAYLEEAQNQNSRNISEIQTTLVEINKRREPLNNRLDVMTDRLNKLDNNFDTMVETQNELRQSLKSWSEQIQLGEYERNQKLKNWEQQLEQFQETMEAYQQQWVQFSDQYKEAKMAVQTLADWQRQLEQQQRETSELARVEINRMQTRWDNFVNEHDKRWKNFEVDVEQRLSNTNRHERKLREKIAQIDEHLETLKQEQEKVWRVQTAQADAIKQLPRIWQEEIENTLENDPNRRRQPTLVPVRDEEL